MPCVEAMRATVRAALVGSSIRLIVSCSSHGLLLACVSNESECSEHRHGRTCPREPTDAEGSDQVEESIQHRE